MNESHRTTAHPEDGDLVRFLDRQATADERRWMLAHLSACGECAARMEALAEQSEALSRVVGELDAGAPDELTRARALSAARQAQRAHGTGRRWLSGGAARAAAVAAVVAVVTLGVEPVRAWVADRWADLVGIEASAPPVAMEPAVLERGSVIRFEPAGETFVLEIEHPQASGSVTLELRDVAQASAQVVGGASEEIIALPSGLKVANTAASTASYTFVLPTDLRLIQVFAGGKPVAIIPIESSGLPGTHTVSLAPEAGRR